MMAQQADLEVGDLVWTGGDCHLYDSHHAQARTQLARDPYPYPTLELRKAPSLFKYRLSDVAFPDYRHHPSIPAPVAV